MMDDVTPAITPITKVPLGFEPISEFEDEAEAYAEWRKERVLDQSVLLVREGRWLSLWVLRNRMWDII
jgi:hypothetical protein